MNHWSGDRPRRSLEFSLSIRLSRSAAPHIKTRVMEITVKKSTMIRPATHTPSHILWCSPLDQRMIRWKHVSLVFFYKSNGSPDFFKPQVLKEALSNVLVPFYPVAGRLGRDESGRIEIICDSQGVLFVEAETTAVLENLNDFASSTKLHPSVDYSGDLSSYPLLLIQVTRFKCGGVALGYKNHHVLSDGGSTSLFLATWCAMARGGRFNGAISPFIDRTIIKSLMPPAPTFHHVEFDPPPSITMPVLSSTTGSTASSVFKITGDQVTKIKAECNKSGKYQYNTFCIVAAHIWRCATKVRALPNDQETKLTIPTDGRSKLRHPPLPQGYFGNCIFNAATIARAGDILSEPFANTVERIHKALNQQDDAYLKSALACLDKLVTNPMSSVHEESPHRCPNLCINKLSRFPVHVMDFGWGVPILMGRPPAGVGMIYMLPPSSTDHDDGGLTLISGLETPHMKIFQELVCQNSASKL